MTLDPESYIRQSDLAKLWGIPPCYLIRYRNKFGLPFYRTLNGIYYKLGEANDWYVQNMEPIPGQPFDNKQKSQEAKQ